MVASGRRIHALLAFSIAILSFGFFVSPVTAAPFCVVAGAVQANDQAFVQLDITMDTADAQTQFPFSILVADPTGVNPGTTLQVGNSDCVITPTQRACTHRITGNRTLFGIPLNNQQPLSYYLQLASADASIVCQNTLAIPAISPPLVCGTSYPQNTQGICPCNNNANPSIGTTGRFCCGWVDDTQTDSCSDADRPALPLCSSALFNQQSTEYAAQVPNSLACQNAFGIRRYKCRDTYDSTPSGCVPKTTCRGMCSGDTMQKDYPNGTRCTGVDGLCYLCVAPAFQQCQATPTPSSTPRTTPLPTTQPPGGGSNSDASDFDSAMMDNINATIFNGAPAAELTTPRGIISRLLPYLFSFAGIILFVMLIWGGFEMLSGAANPKSQEAGKNRITAAIIGFLIIFVAYWLGQLVQAIFGISIL